MLRKCVALTILTMAGSVAAIAQVVQIAPPNRQVRRMILTAPSEGGYLGVQTEDISKENFSKYGLSTVRGVGVDKVVENSPAAKAGLQNGDVILRFDGEEISSVRKLTRIIGETAPDHQVKIIVSRNGGEREISATLGKRQMPQFSGGNFTFGSLPNLEMMPELPRSMQAMPLPPMGDSDSKIFMWRDGDSRQIGVGVTPLTGQLGDYFGAADGKGLLVISVRENSPAAKAGLKAGDVIVEVEGKVVNEMTDLIRAVNEKKEGGIALVFIRDKNRQTVNITPETVKEDKMKPEELQKLFGDAPDKDTEN